MFDYQAPVDDIRFLLEHVFDFDALCSELSKDDEVDIQTAAAVLQEVGKFCEATMAPLNALGDRQGCRWQDGKVTAPDGFAEAYRSFCEGGWGALAGNPDFGGMGLPKTLVAAAEECLQASNMALGLAPMLTAGACVAIDKHASEDIKHRYLPKLYSGLWSGTMALTEPHAGTDIGLIKTKAQHIDDTRYQISGSKIFITWGEHDMAENIVHLVLAKIPGGGEGVKGISLFLVPKYVPKDDGSLAAQNGVSCGSIEEKMGIHGSATCVMNFDGAEGWLIGEPHRGLACMFTMMNYERLIVGIQGLSLADAAYQKAKAYALERKQGRLGVGSDAPSSIIEHQDVRRMLLQIKSVNEGARAFYLYVSTWLDRAKYGANDDAAKATQADQRVALLTPVVKAFLTDRAFEACVDAQQILGGHGYVREWGVEQYVRDVRITQIYEGTNGVQALDFGLRKVHGSRGELLRPYLDEMVGAVNALNEQAGMQAFCHRFHEALTLFEAATEYISDTDDEERVKSACSDYLDMMGYLSLAYMWILQLRVLADSLPQAQNKRLTAEYYFAKVLPAMHSLHARVVSGDSAASAFAVDQF